MSPQWDLTISSITEIAPPPNVTGWVRPWLILMIQANEKSIIPLGMKYIDVQNSPVRMKDQEIKVLRPTLFDK